MANRKLTPAAERKTDARHINAGRTMLTTLPIHKVLKFVIRIAHSMTGVLTDYR